MSFIKKLNDPYSSLDNLIERIVSSEPGHFLLSLGGTELSDQEGISAAGINPEARRLTPAVDAETLVLARPLSATELPVSPLGVVSPVVLTRAALSLLKIKSSIFDCGTFQSPQVPYFKVGKTTALSLATAKALAPNLVLELFAAGQRFAKLYAKQYGFLLLSECVPAGTTTAMAVMTALGYDVRSFVSGSLPVANSRDKWALVQEGLSSSGKSVADFRCDPLSAVSAFGDPMQPFVAGFAAEASLHCPVILAGGSQMLAVFALLKALSEAAALKIDFSSIVIITTKWVAFDQSASTIELAKLVSAPCLAACPDFNLSRHSGLRAYEEGHVKEGVGAGAALGVAFLKGFSEKQILSVVEDCYEQMVLSKPLT